MNRALVSRTKKPIWWQDLEARRFFFCSLFVFRGDARSPARSRKATPPSSRPLALPRRSSDCAVPRDAICRGSRWKRNKNTKEEKKRKTGGKKKHSKSWELLNLFRLQFCLDKHTRKKKLHRGFEKSHSFHGQQLPSLGRADWKRFYRVFDELILEMIHRTRFIHR